MYISLTSSQTAGFKKWSDRFQPSNDDDTPGGATPIAVIQPSRDGGEPRGETMHRPWLVPGVGGSF
jgi:hypothetical protein